MLEGIPESIPCQRLCPWLAQDFLPYVIRKLPGCLVRIKSTADLDRKSKTLFLSGRQSIITSLYNLCIKTSYSGKMF